MSPVHFLVFPAPTFRTTAHPATQTPPILTSCFPEAACKFAPIIPSPTRTAGPAQPASRLARCARPTLLAPLAQTATTCSTKPVRSTVLWASSDSIKSANPARIAALPVVDLLLIALPAFLERIFTIAQRLVAAPLAQPICTPIT